MKQITISQFLEESRHFTQIRFYHCIQPWHSDCDPLTFQFTLTQIDGRSFWPAFITLKDENSNVIHLANILAIHKTEEMHEFLITCSVCNENFKGNRIQYKLQACYQQPA